jgi:hypothetical protein
MEEKKYITMKEAARLLDVQRPSLYYYVKVLKLEKHRFELDRETYLEMSDFERIRKLKEEADQRKKEAA